jgi:stalled ribosome alternative rescue factor ArfA
MAVTTRGESRAKTRGGTMKRKSLVKRRNAPAAALADPLYRKRVVKSAKVYSRKDKVKAIEDEEAK